MSGYVVTGDSHRETERRRRETRAAALAGPLWESARHDRHPSTKK